MFRKVFSPRVQLLSRRLKRRSALPLRITGLVQIEALESRSLLSASALDPAMITLGGNSGSSTAPRIQLDCIVEDTNNDGTINNPTATFSGTFTVTGRSFDPPIANPTSLRGVGIQIINQSDTSVGSITVADFVSVAELQAVGQNATVQFTFNNLTVNLADNATNTLRLQTTGGSNPANNKTSATFNVVVDSTNPDVTINQAAGQNDPTNASTINFTAVFNESVTGFSTGEVSLSGTAGATTATVTGSGTTYNVAVNGMTSDGTVIATINAGVATDTAGNSNNASTSTDNSVTLDTSPPTITDPPALDSADDSGRSNSDAITMQQQNLTFTGTAAGAMTVTVEIRTQTGNMLFASQAATLNGDSYSADFGATTIDENIYNVTAIASDGVNDPVTSDPLTLDIDISQPTPPTIALNTGSDTGVGDDITMDNTPSFDIGGAEVDARVMLFRGNVQVNQQDPASNQTISSISDTLASDGSDDGTYDFHVIQTDLAGNPSNASTTLEVVLDTVDPQVANVGLDPSDQSFPNSLLPFKVTTDTSPTIAFDLTEQRFESKPNAVLVELLDDSDPSTPLDSTTITFGNDENNMFVPGNDETLTSAVTLTANGLGLGSQTVFVRATDAAGNILTTSGNFEFVISEPGEATVGGPSTPVFTEVHDVSGIYNPSDVWPLIQPWQMGFDKTTQTVWVNTELGTQTSQWDPATGAVRVYDLLPLSDTTLTQMAMSGQDKIVVGNDIKVGASLTIDPGGPNEESFTVSGSDDTMGITLTLSADLVNVHAAGTLVRHGTNPHGISFDFDSHLTPRIWIAHRNAGGAGAVKASGAEGIGRLSFFDLVENELVTYSFEGFEDLHGFEIEDTHAVFTDKTGTVWLAAPHNNMIIEVDFDPTDSTQTIDNRTATLTAHHVPSELVDGVDSTDSGFLPHGLEVIVSETGEKYVWSISEGGSARMLLLRPGAADNGDDLWIAWDANDAFEGVRGTFLKVDDNETPGIPEDDTVIGTFPVTRPPVMGGGGGGGGNGSNPGGSAASIFGLMYQLDPGSVLSDPTDLSTPATIRSLRLPSIPGSASEFPAVNQPYLSRSGGAFFIDRFGSIGRFDPSQLLSEVDTLTPARTFVATSAPSSGITIDPTRVVPVDGTIVNDGVAIIDSQVEPAFTNDRSELTGLDLYEVSGPESGGNKGPGAFRGSLNAANILYGSLAQNDMLTTTTFAETTRRQMAVVSTPGGGRMAFQVLRNGSLIMTGREDGELVDRQINLTREIVLRDSIDPDSTEGLAIRISGDSSAVTSDTGIVHVFGKNKNGNIVNYQFDPVAETWSASELMAPPGIVLPDDPKAFVDGDRGVAALATTADGHLLIFPTDGAATDLTDLAAAPMDSLVYATVGVVEDEAAGRIYVYGSDQASQVVQYRWSTTGPIAMDFSADKVVIPDMVREPGQSERDTRMFQSVDVAIVDGVRHVFGIDGHARLVRIEIDGDLNVTAAENISQSIADTTVDNTVGPNRENVDTNGDDRVTGYFPFQMPFVARVYTELSPLVDPNDGSLSVFGTNGGDLVRFTRGGGEWHAANLTNDVTPSTPNELTGANSVFGAPDAYISSDGSTHVFQINAFGEVIVYAIDADQNVATFNVNLARGNRDIASLSDLDAPGDIVDTGTEIIIDNDTIGFDQFGDWQTPVFETGGLNDNVDIIAAGDGRFVSEWSFTDLPSGDYRVSATWTTSSNRTSNAVYVVQANDQTVDQVAVNQQRAPSSFADEGVFWEDLLLDVEVNDGTLRVLLPDQGNGMIVADAIRIELVTVATLTVNSDGVFPISSPSILTLSQLNPIAAEARNRWNATQTGSDLDEIQFLITNLDSDRIAEADFVNLVIRIDDDGAGFGWFVDATPQDDHEFVDGAASIRGVDLLTVVLHEFGHFLDFPGTESPEGSIDLATETLPTGVRRTIGSELVLTPATIAFDNSSAKLVVTVFEAAVVAISESEGNVQVRVNGEVAESGSAILASSVGSIRIDGSPGDDELDLSEVNSAAFTNLFEVLILGRGGDDVIVGSMFADVIRSGAGDDSVSGGAGDDRILGQSGNDVISAESGFNRLIGGPGDDVLTGGTERDRILGNAGNDTIDGGLGNDLMIGNTGDDVLNGDGGNDRIRAGQGNDTGNGGAGNDSIFGGADNDQLAGGEGDDFLRGQGGDDEIDGGNGFDQVFGNRGSDTLKGGAGDDRIFGGVGNDQIFGNNGNDYLVGRAGDDTVSGGNGEDTVLGGSGSDTVLGGADNDTVNGGAQDDIIAGGDGEDHIIGSANEIDESFVLASEIIADLDS